jgi:RHS repeat-associated protein
VPGIEGDVTLGPSSSQEFGIGGWDLGHYHRYDPVSGKLITGGERPLEHGAVSNTLVVAGQSYIGNNNIPGPNPEVFPVFNELEKPEHIAVGPDGAVYFVGDDPYDTLWRLERNGLADGLSRTCDSVQDLAVASDGTVYISCNGDGIRKFVQDYRGWWGEEIVIGGGQYPTAVWQDGEPLLNANLQTQSMAFRDDGRLFFVARQVPSSGYTHGVSDRPYELIEYLPDGRGRVVDVDIGRRIAAGPNNTIVSIIGEDVPGGDGRVVQISPTGASVELMAPTAPDGSTREAVGSDWESTETHWAGVSRLRSTSRSDITSTPNGDVYVSYQAHYCEASNQLFQISPRGEVRSVSIADVLPANDDATRFIDSCSRPRVLANGGEIFYLAAGPDGALYATDKLLHRLYAVRSSGGYSAETGSFEVGSQDGTEIYHFTAAGLHERTEDARTGATLYSFIHGTDGTLESITDQSGRTTSIEHPDDSTIRIVAPGGPDGTPGSSTEIRLDAAGYIGEVEDARGALWSFEYDNGGLLERMWDPRANEHGLHSGNPFVFQYERFNDDADARWLLLEDSDPVGGRQTLSATQSRNVVPIYATWCDGSQYVRGHSVTDTTSTITKTTALGREATFVTVQSAGSPRLGRFDGEVLGRVTTTKVEPSGWSTTRSSPGNDGIALVEWPGASLSYTTSSHPRLLAGAQFVQDAESQIEAVTGAHSRNALSLNVSRELETDFLVSRWFDVPMTETLTRTQTPSTGTPRTTTIVYDGATRATTSSSAEGRSRSHLVDGQGRVVELSLPGQVPATFAYDSNGFLRSVTRTNGASSRIAEFGYDMRGYVDSVRNKVSETVTDEVTMDNDAMGFATGTTVPGLLSVGSTPDIAGALSTLTPDSKPTHRLSYTPLGQLSQYASPAGSLSTDGSCPSGTQCWHYSLDREFDDITLPDGTIVDYTYDAVKGTLSSIDVPGHGMTTFTYDSVGRRDSATAPTGGTMGFGWQSTLPISTSWSGAHTVPGVPGTVSLNGTVERFYNDFVEVSELRVTGGASVQFLRDNDGLVTDIVDVGGVSPTLTLSRSAIDGHIDGTTFGSVTTTRTLDVSETTPGFGDLLSVSANAGITDLYDSSYTYDDRGRIRTWTESVQGGVAVTRTFDYDAAGLLRAVHDITGGEPGTLLEEYAYDGNGNRQRALSQYPGAVPLNAEFGTNLGCVGPSGDTAANDQDQLCQYGDYEYIYNPRGQLQSRSDGAVTTTYSYDGVGRLKRVTEPGMELQYVHDALGRRIGKIRDGSLEKGWLYADALNPIAQLDQSGNVEATFVYGSSTRVPDAMVMTDGTDYRFIADQLGSVRLVVNAETGTVVQRIDYDTFGRVLSDSNPGFQPFGFAGGLYDDDTGLVRFGARDYDAYAGRWTTKDPIRFGGGDSNLYAYASSDPLNSIDPNGQLAGAVFGPAVAVGLALLYVYLQTELHELRDQQRQDPEDEFGANSCEDDSGVFEICYLVEADADYCAYVCPGDRPHFVQNTTGYCPEEIRVRVQ